MYSKCHASFEFDTRVARISKSQQKLRSDVHTCRYSFWRKNASSVDKVLRYSSNSDARLRRLKRNDSLTMSFTNASLMYRLP